MRPWCLLLALFPVQLGTILFHPNCFRGRDGPAPASSRRRSGPSGFEEAVRKIMVERMRPLADKISYDGLGR